jgi:hypothetical protein
VGGQVGLCFVWVLIGVVVEPFKLLPYAVAVLCFLFGTAAAYARLRRWKTATPTGANGKLIRCKTAKRRRCRHKA